MANLSDMLGNFAIKKGDILDTTQKATATGLQLATIEDEVGKSRAELQVAQQKALAGKFENQLTWLERINRAQSPQQKKIMLEAANRNFGVMGLPPISPMTADEMTNDPQVQANMAILIPALRKTGVDEATVNEVASGLASETGVKENVQLLLEAIKGQRAEKNEAIRLAREGRQIKQQEFTNLKSVREDFDKDPITKNTKEILQANQKIQGAKDKNDAASSISMVYNYMKMLDPGSTVREGEYATAQSAAGVPDRIKNAYNNAIKGTKIGVRQRKEFAAEAERILESQLEQQESVNSRYEQLVGDAGQDKEKLRIPANFRPKPKEAVAAKGNAPAAPKWADPKNREAAVAAIMKGKGLDRAAAEQELDAEISKLGQVAGGR